MGIHIRNFGITFFVFMVVDLIWLGLIAKNLYAKYLGYIMAEKVNWSAAIIFYILFIIGLIYFVITPADSIKDVIVSGALFGLITYATYDLTNLATLKNWPITITIIDLIWGTTLATVTSAVSYLIINGLGK
ncbi:DUF2177 family protein [Fusibacter tunisiensis]|uniref:Membrane protein n=1 Tax=Fusibacter tunisiensis TaxID=1008308 RepID=A0ABS2MP21_9FIRM|nr:DUF2177 family protein [Fusibacter tunisiensis]MBM7561142.1 putative membrane protein [Fusibacter tunisiensis]